MSYLVRQTEVISKSITMYFTFFSLLLPSSTTASANITAIFAFGDSILDSGNNNALATLIRADHHPYGIDFPSRAPTGRMSNGKLITDFLASQLGLKEFLPAFLDPSLTDQDILTGASFASSGSGLDDFTAKVSNVLSFQAQLAYFEQAVERMKISAGSAEMGRAVNNAMFMISAGINDMDNFYNLRTRTNFSVSDYQDFLLKNLEDVVRKMHELGARRFAVMGLPPIGCLPMQVTIGSTKLGRDMFHRRCIVDQNLNSQAYNAKLQILTSRLHETLPGSKVTYLDFYSPLMQMIMNPTSYGFKKTLEGCCGLGAFEVAPLCNAFTPTCPDSTKYIFWDSIHPSQAAYKSLAKFFQQNIVTILPD